MAAQVVGIVGVVLSVSAGTLSPVVETRGAFHGVLSADLDGVFFSLDEFGENVRYTHVSSGQSSVYPALVDLPSADQGIISESSVIGFKPQVQISRHRIAAAPSKGDRLTVRGARYRVENYTDDGVGVVTLYLSRV